MLFSYGCKALCSSEREIEYLVCLFWEDQTTGEWGYIFIISWSMWIISCLLRELVEESKQAANLYCTSAGYNVWADSQNTDSSISVWPVLGNVDNTCCLLVHSSPGLLAEYRYYSKFCYHILFCSYLLLVPGAKYSYEEVILEKSCVLSECKIMRKVTDTMTFDFLTSEVAMQSVVSPTSQRLLVCDFPHSFQ